MIELFAQPYDTSANGFYFSRASEYAMASMNCRNSQGTIVEEYEIQFINGFAIDCDLAKAWNLNQTNFAKFLEKADEWDDWQKVHYIISINECGYSHEEVVDKLDTVDITVYECDTMKELAEQFVDEGLFGDIPERLQSYIDYDAIARDLSVDYAETAIAGTTYIYRQH